LRLIPLLLLLAVSGCALFGSSPKYLVFFQERSTQLDSAAQGVIGQAAARASSRPAAKVEVLGYTDSAGSPSADVILSQQRAQAVADALVANGVAPARLIRSGQGQSDAEPGVASRRVEIVIGP
jgi:outer membrane protein OmpA-like peptidoglycan-associated protein